MLREIGPPDSAYKNPIDKFSVARISSFGMMTRTITWPNFNIPTGLCQTLAKIRIMPSAYHVIWDIEMI
jgi:hypothetical protein